ncbi:MAG: peptidoglycan DD-metalloendopeptidase family protein [Maricaulaceae bacterium]
MLRQILISLALLGATPTYAQDVDQTDLDGLLSQQEAAATEEARLKVEREKIQTELKGINNRLTQQVKSIAVLGQDLHTSQLRFQDLDQNYRVQKLALKADQDKLSNFLGYIQRIDRHPPSPATTSPRSALKASQTALLIQTMTREFDQRSRVLEARISELTILKDSLISEQSALERKQSRLKQQEIDLKSLVDQRRKKAASIAGEEKKARQEAADLAAKAKSLKQLLETLEAATSNIQPRVKPRNSTAGPAPSVKFSQINGVKAFTQAKRQLLSPVKGRLLKKYGKGEQGLTLSAPSASEVKAPYSGRVDFSGPFKDYEHVVILNVGEGYFLLLTGLANSIVEVGEQLSRGTSVGALPASRTGQAEIYIELRKGSNPVDPTPWFSNF